MTPGENLLRAVRFEQPDWIPMAFHINAACWNAYPHDALQELMVRHPLLFPDYEPVDRVEPHFTPVQLKDTPYRDPWGCVWVTEVDGLTGTVREHPLADWAAFETYEPPDPSETDGLVPIDWDAVAERYGRARERGDVPQASLRHGHTFLQLSDIRGYENLMFDMADDEPQLWELMEMLEAFNLEIVRRHIRAGAGAMGYPEDLGMQVGPMLSPRHFRKYIKPTYQRLMAPAREAGCIVHMHSDGDIRELADDLVEGGVEVINLQDLVNGIDWIAERFAGRVCIDLDIDRQHVTVRGTPEQIDALIREEVEKLGSPEGGLMMIFGLYPGTPLENVAALMDAMERYAAYYT